MTYGRMWKHETNASTYVIRDNTSHREEKMSPDKRLIWQQHILRCQ